jgi:plastocyanin
MRARSILSGIVAVLLMIGCAGPQRMATVPSGPGPQIIALRASNFDFQPERIVAPKGSTLRFSVENASGMAHNFTVKDPAGNVLQSVSLPAHSTKTVDVKVEQTGAYPFYCDIPMHPLMGMKGTIEVQP